MPVYLLQRPCASSTSTSMSSVECVMSELSCERRVWNVPNAFWIQDIYKYAGCGKKRNVQITRSDKAVGEGTCDVFITTAVTKYLHDGSICAQHQLDGLVPSDRKYGSVTCWCWSITLKRRASVASKKASSSTHWILLSLTFHPSLLIWLQYVCIITTRSNLISFPLEYLLL